MEVADWGKIHEHIRRGLPAVIPVSGKHGIAFVVAQGAASLGLRIPYSGAAAVSASPYKELAVGIVRVKNNSCIEISTRSAELFDIFYLFGCAAAEGVEERGLEAPAAVEAALESFGQLLTRRSLMSEEGRLGLFGELSVLEAILKRQGPRAFQAWLGPRKERHDFRLAGNELEVKSTRRVKRIHVIHGLAQLEPSAGHRLFVLSLQFEPAGHGAGRSLVDRIKSVREMLAGGTGERAVFEDFLSRLGYRDADAQFYTEAMQFFRRPVLVEVDADCPGLTSARLSGVMQSEILNRIDRVEYEVNLEGLGLEEGSKRYSEILEGVATLD